MFQGVRTISENMGIVFIDIRICLRVEGQYERQMSEGGKDPQKTFSAGGKGNNRNTKHRKIEF